MQAGADAARKTLRGTRRPPTQSVWLAAIRCAVLAAIRCAVLGGLPRRPLVCLDHEPPTHSAFRVYALTDLHTLSDTHNTHSSAMFTAQSTDAGADEQPTHTAATVAPAPAS